MPDGAHTFPTVIITGKVSCGAFQLKQDNEFDMDVSQYVTGPQQNMQAHCYYPKGHLHFTKTLLPAASKHVVVHSTIQKIMEDCCVVTVKDITLGHSDRLLQPMTVRR